MSCTYEYNGKRFTRVGILKKIRAGELSGVADMDQARSWLETTIGLKPHEIEIVRGLIEGKAIGRTLKDGRILLSDQMHDGVQYHEGFHRVFGMLLTPEEQTGILAEFRQRDNWSSLLDRKRQLYPGKSEDKLIEEYLADEFMMYQLNNGNYPVPGTRTRSFFQRIIDFFRTLFGQGPTPITIEELYRNIRTGRYASRPVVGYPAEDSDALIIDGHHIPAPEKQEIVENVVWRILYSVVRNKGIYRLMDGRFNITSLYDQALWGLIQDELLPRSANANIARNTQLLVFDNYFIGEDGQPKVDDKGFRKMNANSQLFAEVSTHLATLGVKLKGFVPTAPQETANGEDRDINNEDAEPDEETAVKDFAFSKISFEFDPKQGISKGIRLLLSAIADVDENGQGRPSRYLGIARPVKYSTLAGVLFHELAGLPADYQVIHDHLREAARRYPYLRELLMGLGSPRLSFMTDYDQHRLRNEFVTGFTKNRYNFLIGLIREDNIYATSLVSDNQRTKVISEWRNRVLQRYATADEMVLTLKGTSTASDIAEALGMDEFVEDPSLLHVPLNEETPDIVAKRLGEIEQRIIQSLEKGTPIHKIFDRNPNEELSVEGSIRSIADVVASQGRPVDLMLINTEGKRVYSVSMHNYQTVLLGTLNWIGTQDLTIEEKVEMVKRYAPHVLNPNTYDSESGEFRSRWLQHILQGNSLKLEVFDGIRAAGQGETFSDLKETDQLAFQIAAQQQGRTFAFKHGDRSVMFAYSFADKHQTISRTHYEGIMAEATDKAMSYLQDEVRRVMRVRQANKDRTPEASENGYGISNYSRRGTGLVQFSFLTERQLEQAIAIMEEPMTDGNRKAAFMNAFGTPVRAHFENLTSHTREELSRWGVDTFYKRKGSTLKPIGIGKPAWDAFMRENGNDPNRALNAAAGQATVNYFFSYAEQSKLLVGDLASYKSAQEFYKRLRMQSSTGEIFVVDADNNEYIEFLQQRDVINMRDPVTGKMEKLNYGPLKRTGFQSEIVLKSSKYRSRITTTENGVPSKLNGELVSPIRSVFEQGVYADLLRTGFSEEEAKRIALERAVEWEAPFTSYDENDGMSWGSLFFWREYHHRAGTYSRQKENTFQIELAVMEAEDMSDTLVYVSRDRMTIRAHVEPQELHNYHLVRVFDRQDVRQRLGLDQSKWFNKVLDYGTMAKPQYTGPFYPDGPPSPDTVGSADMLIAGRKTAYGFLFPSMIRGTKLEQMHAVMLRKGIDTFHMDSASKYGMKEPGAFAPESAYTLYDTDGQFNQEIEEFADHMVSYLDLRYQKDQIRIHTEPKEKIKNATQSAKILLSNLMDQGIPRDISTEQVEEFEAANEEQRKAMSPMFRLYKDYEDALSDLIYDRMEALEEELGVTDENSTPETQKLYEILRRNAEEKSSPLYVLEAIDAFLDSENVELLPNSNRVQNLLFSIVTNKVISLKRSGDSKPQFSASLYEPITRNRNRTEDGHTLSSETVEFYRPVFNEEGDLTALKPAEMIIPLPPKMVNMLLELTGEQNIMRAIRIYNGWSEDRKFRVKALRIPNQQLSFNDVLVIKKFSSPLYQGYAILPSEIVVKTGSDFDIDKVQIYMPSLDPMGNVIQYDADDPTPEGVMNDLLEREMDILLHPRNAHYLLAPSSDNWLKEDLFAEIVSKMENVSKAEVLRNRDAYEMKMTNAGVMSLVDNVVNGIMLIESKANVGLIATGVTIHAVGQADNLRLSPTYKRPEKLKDGKVSLVEMSTQLPFAGMEGMYDMSSIMDVSGRTVLEVLSTLLTSQVDGSNNPYAPKLNLVTETLSIVTFMVRRRVPLKAALAVVSAPIVRKYLELQRIHRSSLYRGTAKRGKNRIQMSKDKVMDAVAKSVGSNGDELKTRIVHYQRGNGYQLTETDLQRFISDNAPNANQLQALAAYLFLDGMSQDFRPFSADMTPDTRPMKNMAAVDSMEENYAQLQEREIIDTDHRDGFLYAFFEARQMYKDLFEHLYKLPRQRLSRLAAALSAYKTPDEKIAIRERLSEDLLTYMLQNYIEPYASYDFDSLMSGPNSVAVEIQQLKEGIHPVYRGRYVNNFAIQSLLPMFKAVEKDEYTGNPVDVVRILERGATTMTFNDMYEEFQVLPVDIKEKLMVLSLYQAGMSYSPFSLDPMLEVAIKKEAMSEAIKYVDDLDDKDFSDFIDRFMLNHPELLPTWTFQAEQLGIPYIAVWDESTGERVVQNLRGEVIAPYGSRYHKRYNTELTPTLKTTDQFVGEQEQRNEQILRDMLKSAKRVTLKMQPDNLDRIASGQKTTTIRSDKEMAAIGLAVGQSGITTIQGRDYLITNRGYMTIAEAGGAESVLASEGYQSMTQIKFPNVKKWFAGQGRLYIYDIRPAPIVAAPSTTLIFTKRTKGIGEEISSKSDNLAFALTNPTHTSPSGKKWSRKWTDGQTKWRAHMANGIMYEGRRYQDVEEAYQQNKEKFPIGPKRDAFMKQLMKIKLTTYPVLVKGITEKGGVSYLTDSTHQPTNQNSHWESGGDNAFIRLLTEAYLEVLAQRSTTNIPPASADDWTQGLREPRDVADEEMLSIAQLRNNADASLDARLKEVVKSIGGSVEVVDHMRERFGYDALGVTDVLNKVISVASQRNIDTVAEEVAHMVVFMLGSSDFDISLLLESIHRWEGYAAVYEKYHKLYKDNEEKIKLEAIGQLITKSMVRTYKKGKGSDVFLARALRLFRKLLRKLAGMLGLPGMPIKYVKAATRVLALEILTGEIEGRLARRNLNTKNREIVIPSKALQTNILAKDVHEFLSSNGLLLTGSLAIAHQGVVLRPADEQVHDLDYWVSQNDATEIWKVLAKAASEFDVRYSPRRAMPGGEHDIMVVTFRPFGSTPKVELRDTEIGGGRDANITDSAMGLIGDRDTSEISVDFFIANTDITKDNDGKVLSWDEVFKGKLSLSASGAGNLFYRGKDLIDFFEFRPYDEEQRAKIDEKYLYFQLGEEELIKENGDDPTAATTYDPSARREEVKTNNQDRTLDDPNYSWLRDDEQQLIDEQLKSGELELKCNI